MSSDQMPVFVIKAKDNLAPLAVADYLHRCAESGLDAQAEQVALALDEINAWRQRNRHLCQDPDHIHVPVDQL